MSVLAHALLTTLIHLRFYCQVSVPVDQRLMGKHLRIAELSWAPFGSMVNGEWEGFDIEAGYNAAFAERHEYVLMVCLDTTHCLQVLKSVAQSLGFTYDIIEVMFEQQQIPDHAHPNCFPLEDANAGWRNIH